MKLKLKHFFEIEYDNENGQTVVLKGYSKELTKKQSQKLKDIFKEDEELEKKLNSMLQIRKDLEIEMAIANSKENFDEVKSLNERLKKLDFDYSELERNMSGADLLEKGLMARFDMTIEGEDKEAIKELAETYGYKLIFETINKDIEEKKHKDKKN